MKPCLLVFATVLAFTGAAPLHAGLREDGPRPEDFASAQAAMQLSQFEWAADAFARILIRYPNSADAWMGLAVSLGAQKFRSEADIAYLNAANLLRERVRVFPKDAAAYGRLIDALRGNPRAGDAKAVLAEGLRLNPEDPRLLALHESYQPRRNLIETREYQPSGFLKDEIAGKNPAAVKDVLERHGVEFPGGGSAAYISRSNRLIVRGTTTTHSAVESLVSAD